MGEEEPGFTAEDKVKLDELLETSERPNPFAYDDAANWSTWEFIKCCLGIVIVPIRLTIAIFCLVSSERRSGYFIFSLT